MSIEILEKIELFENLSNTEIESLAKIMHPVSFKKDEFLFYEGDTGDSLYFIKEGNIKITKTSKDGKEKILAILSDFDYLGEMSILDEELRSASAQCMNDSSLLVMHKKDFFKLLENNFTIVTELITTLSKRVRSLNNEIENLVFNDVNGQFANLLIELSNKYGVMSSGNIILEIAITHKDLGAMIGVSRETVTRIISRFKKLKLIEMSKKKIIITDIDKLNEYVELK